MQGTALGFDGSCGFYWTKKNGTQYAFYAPFATGCNTTSDTGSFGRIIYIFGRNANNYVHFVYSWNGNDSSSDNLSSIAVKHSDGQSLTLEFAKFSGSSHAELAHVVRPDGDTVDFYYDTTTGTHLTEVDQPGHGSGGLYSQYAYYGSSDQLNYVCSPRYVAAVLAGTNDGGCSLFSFASTDINGVTNNNVTTGAWNWVWANFTPADNMGAPLQPNLNNGYYYVDSRTFTYSSAPSSNSTWETWMTDTDGHSTQYFIDASGRLTQRDDYVGSAQVTWLIRTNTWDASNDLTSTVDPRGFGLSGSPNPYETDYAYDANGNTIAVALPSVTTNDGALRPTSIYSYDAYNNLLSYCDPVYNAPNSWYNPANTPPSCPTTGIGDGYTIYTWNESDTNEPFGYLTDTYTPLGYHHAIAYNTSGEGGDFGLPTSVTGTSYTQNDGTVRTPSQTFTYDSFGDLATYNKGNGAWTLTYDNLNRLVKRTDPDNVSSYTCYNADDTVSLQRSASQYAADSSESCAGVTPATSAGVSFTYDQDGNELTELHHHGCTAVSGCGTGQTSKWYDGQDRLVEVRQPQDGNDAYAFAWMTRYIYDITQGQPVSITGGASGFYAYGNLYKTQECIQAASVQLQNQYYPLTARTQAVSAPIAPTVTGGCTFTDLRGNTFDALDRSLTKYEVAAGTAPETTDTYDGSGEYGLLSGKTNPLGQADTLAYDGDDHLASETFTDGITPNRTYVYDPDGRETSLTSTTLGTQTRAYDADGRVVSSTDPSNEQDPDSISYSYYGDGLRSSLSLSVPGLGFNQSNLFTYSYRADGMRSSLVSAIGAGNGAYAWTYTSAGRELTQSDPLTGTGAGASGQYPLVAKSLTYDSYGRLSGLTLPRSYNPETSIAYDLEDSIANAAWTGAATSTYQYTTRNEVPGVTNATNGQTSQAYSVQYANGSACTGATTCTFDSRSGQMLSQQVNLGQSGLANPTHSYTYDAAGRETNDTLTCGSATPETATRTYDTDNHIVQQALPSLFTATNSCSVASLQEALSYSWGADGRLSNFSTTTYYPGSTPPSVTNNYSAHWDGDDLLYVSMEGVAIQLYVEKLAVITQNSAPSSAWQTMIYDRDQTGTAVNDHFSIGTTPQAGFPTLTVDNIHPFRTSCSAKSGNCQVSQLPPSPSVGGPAGVSEYSSPPGAILDATRSDGYYDGTVAIQGARSYDPNMNQWTTPDAYSGDVHDPMSQHPYVWSKNNPLQYEDPSGYDSLTDDAEYGPTPDDGHPTAANGTPTKTVTGQSDPNNGHYQTLNDAARAAAGAYNNLSKDSEVGCAVYCTGGAGTCGYGPATIGPPSHGSYGNVGVDLSPYQGDRQVGIWHTHPAGAGADTTGEHADNASRTFHTPGLRWLDSQPFTIYTSVSTGLVFQRYTMLQADTLSSEGADVDPEPVPQ
jgi:YD repeat-containing protein